ncbi:IclR family transcriptional regulator [Pseudonocardia sulfidoxydans]|uniref:IclR family transcriptional regulator n=1 Tax=Pseudonocardia sulfidoxydans TaxID=54011 RepID=UPI0016497FD1|nr:IclR family transcriptional regulator [Pseudonocardia sulfidoxydans]
MIDRALNVLEHLVTRGQPEQLADIAAQTAIPKGTLHRILQTLQARGYVAQERDGRYAAGIRCFELGSLWAQNLDMRMVAAPHLLALNEDTKETVHLGVYEQGDVIYIDKLESPHQVVARTYVGRRCPATCVATGRVLLAYSDAYEIDRVLAEPLPAYTEDSITDATELRDLLAEVRRTGYAVNHGSYRHEVGGIAGPVRDYTGRVVASVGLCMPEHRFGPERFDDLRSRVLAAAAAVTTALGGAVLAPATNQDG